MAFERQYLGPDTPFLCWAYEVLQVEGLSDWSIELGEAYCWQTLKIITFGKYRAESRSLFLHEVAHALAPEPETVGVVLPQFIFGYTLTKKGGQQYHGGCWADAFTKLCEQYLEGYVDRTPVEPDTVSDPLPMQGFGRKVVFGT